MSHTVLISKCCGTALIIRNSGGGATHWYECARCGKPCDATKEPEA